MKIDTALAHFSIEPESTTPLSAGWNTSYRVTSNGKAFILKQHVEASEERADAEMALLATLNDAGLPCPRPVRVDDRYAATIDGTVVTLEESLPGEHRDPLTSTDCETLAQTIARMHKLTAGYGDPRFTSIDLWENAQRQIEYNKPLGEIAERAARTVEDSWPHATSDALPRGVIHNDLNKGNLLWQEDALSGIIDFGDAGIAPLILDLADMIANHCFRAGSLDRDAAQQLIDAYSAVRDLSATERAAIDSYVTQKLLLIGLYTLGTALDHDHEPSWPAQLDAVMH